MILFLKALYSLVKKIDVWFYDLGAPIITSKGMEVLGDDDRMKELWDAIKNRSGRKPITIPGKQSLKPNKKR